MKHYPFPNKENSMQELREDYVFSKIEPNEVERIFEEAWAVGEEQARRFLAGHRQETRLVMREILEDKGVTVLVQDVDYVLGKRRYFCEFLSGRNQLKIYKKSVELWCEENGFGYEEGLNVILCHEYFHYLEWNEIGMASRIYQVPILKLGPLKIGKTGVPSLSEIGANAFASVCYRYLLEKEEV